MYVEDMPGNLKLMYKTNEWLDLVFKSDLEPIVKLVAVVISKTFVYNKTRKMYLSNISTYSISRIVKTSQDEVRECLEVLFNNGWLYDTGQRSGARMMFTPTFSLTPIKMRR